MDGSGFMQRKLTVTAGYSPCSLCELEVFIDRGAKRILALRISGAELRFSALWSMVPDKAKLAGVTGGLKLRCWAAIC
jgi:hypothetical protein